jgi:sigma-54 dependent transcriptional regulator, acetoin dehydrogenase operon transcriptional activator AcoR
MSNATVSVHDVEHDVPLAGVPCLVRALRCDRPLEPPARIMLEDVSRVVLGRGDLGHARDGDELVIRCPDDRMSSVHARLVREGQAFTLVDDASKNGTLVNGRRCDSARLADGDVIETGHTYFVFRARVPRGLPEHPAELAPSKEVGEIPLVTFVWSLAKQLDRAARVAPSALPVIVLGETGTGKEVVARALHRMSARSGAFVAINCGAIPATLVEGELFGSRRGAFSGAVDDRPGLVRAADAGTLFLDEIGELPLPAQVALLRVLQEQEVLPIGATKPVKVDVRVVAATHRALDRLVDTGDFRADLFARLGGLTIRLPSLRERREDLGLIIASLLHRMTPHAERIALSRQAARALFLCPFRHNIRELEKAISLAVTIAVGDAELDGPITIELDDLPDELRASELPKGAAPQERASDDEDRKAHLVALLTQHHGRVADVARAMGKARMQIHRWIQRYGLDLEAFRKAR